MQLYEQIRENRKKMGLTQEQIATYLGISTPAVNKWERGITYPDITLLPAIARLLKIDMNTLFSFDEELTEVEIKSFILSLVQMAHDGDLGAAFEAAEQKIHEYPLSNKLLYEVANILDAEVVLLERNSANKTTYDEKVIDWYECAASSTEESIKYAAIGRLAKKYMKRSEFDKARMLVEKLPEGSSEKTDFQVELLLHQGETAEAAAVMQGKLLHDLEKVQRTLYRLIDIELNDDHVKEAKDIADMTQDMVGVFGLWKYGAITPYLQIALYEKNVEQSLKQITAIIDATYEPWDMKQSPIFYRIAQEKFLHMENYFMPAFIAELKKDSHYDFLRTNKIFMNLQCKWS